MSVLWMRKWSVAAGGSLYLISGCFFVQNGGFEMDDAMAEAELRVHRTN